MRTVSLTTTALYFTLWSTGSLAADAYSPGDLRSVGAVTFSTSCSHSVQSDFDRGVALLHSFFYEESRRIFTSIAERDSTCAMAQWGIAQTWWHPIWAPPSPDEFQAGRLAAERALALPSTARERGFIEAIAAYYSTADVPAVAPVGQSCHGPVGTPARVVAYQRVMQTVADTFPKDYEVRVFNAFAILAVGYATPTDLSQSNQQKAGELLEQLWKENPHHPGVAHYIIHSYDSPTLAARALPAAEAYTSLAPWVPHALHMPSHIFTRLGMWDQSIDSNRASAEASRAYAKQRGRSAVEVEELHALDYLMYSYLQEGRDADARAVFDEANNVRETFPAMDFVGAYALAAIPVRFALEREAWQEAASAPIPLRAQWERYPFTEALFEYGHALGRVHVGDIDGARKAIARMHELHDATTDIKFDYFRRHLDLQMQAASAWLAHANGHDDEAIAALRTVADAEDALGKHPVTPGALMPAREQLGSLLLELNRPREALVAYEAALKIYPARFRGLNGAAVAAASVGDRNVARKYFAHLVKQAGSADATRTEIAYARVFLDQTVAAVR